MINLLPSETKQDIRAARTNVVLLRYNFLTLAAAAALVAICAISYIILSANQSDAVTQNATNSKKAADYRDTSAKADTYRKNLATAKAILGSSVNYTSVVFNITALLPEGTVLDNLTINSGDFDKQITLTAHAKSYTEALKLKESFEQSKVFSNVFFQSISSNDQTSTAYPIDIALSAKLNKAVQL